MKKKQLTLLFDVSPLANSKKSGVGFYTERLLHALATRYPDDLRIIGHYFNFLDKKDVSLPKYQNVEYRHTKFFPSKLINIMRRFGIEPPVELFLRDKGDFILYPNFVSYPSLRKTPSATVVHDLGYLDCPEYVQAPNRRFLARYVPRSIRRSRVTVVISDVTRKTVMKYYRTPADKFIKTPIPTPVTKVVPMQPKQISGKFILFIGTLEPRKNFINLVRAYMLLPADTRKEYGLVLAGGTGWYVDKDLAEIRKLQDSGENIVMTGYFSDEEKAWMLKNCSVFVQPSHYEGFGMPILEAMEAGAPTAVSDIPIFHEVSEDASLYFNHTIPQSITDNIQRILGDQKLQQVLREKGYQQVKKLDWNTIAEQLYERIRSEIES
jgi:glycosyltransferase involved in cell wall biosynthesis